MSITWTDVVTIAPELDALDASAQVAILADVAAQLANTTAWGTSLDRASKYLAAHFGTLVLRGATGAAGPVQSESAGGISRSYAVSVGDAALESTVWGIQYKKLRAAVLLGARFGIVT